MCSSFIKYPVSFMSCYLTMAAQPPGQPNAFFFVCLKLVKVINASHSSSVKFQTIIDHIRKKKKKAKITQKTPVFLSNLRKIDRLSSCSLQTKIFSLFLAAAGVGGLSGLSVLSDRNGLALYHNGDRIEHWSADG